MNRILTAIAAMAYLSLAQAQTTKEELTANYVNASNNYAAYRTPSGKQTPAPAGYEPFYISHYGRHGSRNMSSATDVKEAISFLEQQDMNDLGRSTLGRLKYIDSLMAGKIGSLTPLGYQQMHEIATRMLDNYPTVFANKKKIEARSTIVPRSIASMAAFCLALQKKDSELDITPYVNDEDMPALNKDRVKDPNRPAEETAEYAKRMKFFAEKNGTGERLVSSLIKGKAKTTKEECAAFGINLFNVASATQCLPGIDFNLLELFTKDELWDRWRARSSFWYFFTGAYATPNIRAKEFGEPLWLDIIERADAAIKGGGKCADLRFGHDTGLVPILVYLGIDDIMKPVGSYEEVHTSWADYKVTTMATNLQMVFYKNNEGKVLVKFLLNEEEATLPLKTNTWPYYDWENVKKMKE